MESKCEWKDEKFYPCEMFNGVTYRNKPKKIGDSYKYYCEGCGADIRKPEPVNPLIVKSNGTYVAYDKGVNYLWTGTLKELINLDNAIRHFTNFVINKTTITNWIPFTDKNGKPILELTDEIAKYRPMVFRNGLNRLEILYGVNGDTIIYEYGNGDITNCRLATPHELQEIPNA